jgi:hypothetical protein
VLGGSVVA